MLPTPPSSSQPDSRQAVLRWPTPRCGLVSLYVAAALFGLFQGGILPSYAIIMGTLLGMALGDTQYWHRGLFAQSRETSSLTIIVGLPEPTSP